MPTETPTLYWAGPPDALAGSTYDISVCLNGVDWTTVATGRAATSPYAAVAGTLGADAQYGATSVVLTSGTSFATSGRAWLERSVLIQWTGKSTNTLTGVTWNGGYGTYASGTEVLQCNESYTDSARVIDYGAACYQITHNLSGRSSPPLYYWFFAPSVPASGAHCVVIVLAGRDVGQYFVPGIKVRAALSNDAAMHLGSGAHLDANTGASYNEVLTNVMGIAELHLVRDVFRRVMTGVSAPAYIVELAADTLSVRQVQIGAVPDQNVAHLLDLVT